MATAIDRVRILSVAEMEAEEKAAPAPKVTLTIEYRATVKRYVTIAEGYTAAQVSDLIVNHSDELDYGLMGNIDVSNGLITYQGKIVASWSDNVVGIATQINHGKYEMVDPIAFAAAIVLSDGSRRALPLPTSLHKRFRTRTPAEQRAHVARSSNTTRRR